MTFFILVVFSGREVVAPGTVVTGVVVTVGSGSQSPKRSSSASHSASSPGQQPCPKSSQSSALGTQAGSGSMGFSSQHPSPKSSQSGSSTQGGSVTRRGPP